MWEGVWKPLPESLQRGGEGGGVPPSESNGSKMGGMNKNMVKALGQKRREKGPRAENDC